MALTSQISQDHRLSRACDFSSSRFFVRDPVFGHVRQMIKNSSVENQIFSYVHLFSLQL